MFGFIKTCSIYCILFSLMDTICALRSIGSVINTLLRRNTASNCSDTSDPTILDTLIGIVPNGTKMEGGRARTRLDVIVVTSEDIMAEISFTHGAVKYGSDYIENDIRHRDDLLKEYIFYDLDWSFSSSLPLLNSRNTFLNI